MVTEQDRGQTVLIELMSHQDLFEIVNGNQLVTKATLDHEQQSEYQVKVKCTDDGSPPQNVSLRSKVKMYK